MHISSKSYFPKYEMEAEILRSYWLRMHKCQFISCEKNCTSTVSFLNCSTNVPNLMFSSVQSLSHVRLFSTPWTATRQASLSIPKSRTLPKLMCIKSVMPSSHLILCHSPLLLPPIPPSIRVFSSEINSSHEVAKVLEFQPQHQSFQWTPRTDLL